MSAPTPGTKSGGDRSGESDADMYNPARSCGRKSTSPDDSLRRQVQELRTEIGRQRSIIIVLTTRLNFVLSMSGADDVTFDEEIPASASGGDPTVVKTAVDPVAKSTGIDPQLSFRGAVVSAIYYDMKDQENRSRNFVVSGLPVGASSDDKTVVEALCESELRIRPDIKSCRRLGR